MVTRKAIGAFEGSANVRKFESSTVNAGPNISDTTIDLSSAFNRKTAFKPDDIGFISPSAIGGGYSVY